MTTPNTLESMKRAATANSRQLWSYIQTIPQPLTVPPSSSTASAAATGTGGSRHKGECGRLGIIGGSKAYTGAPYFSAMTTLRMGVDLSTIFCSVEASIPIKSYSPDLMVRPTLYPHYMKKEAVQELQPTSALTETMTDTKAKSEGPSTTTSSNFESDSSVIRLIVEDMDQWTKRMDVIIIGPGLGQDPFILATLAEWMNRLKDESSRDRSKMIPLVIDGDGIQLLIQYSHLLQPNTSSSNASSASSSSTTTPSASAAPASSFHEHLLLTPNAMEFRRLFTKFQPDKKPPEFNLPLEQYQTLLEEIGSGGEISVEHPLVQDTALLARSMGGVTICRKGVIDLLTDGRHALIVNEVGSPRRVGGQGDVLAGACGTFIGWIRTKEKEKSESKDTTASSTDDSIGHLSPMLLGGYAASQFSRKVQHHAFGLHQRSMLTTHLLEAIPSVMQHCFPVNTQPKHKL